MIFWQPTVSVMVSIAVWIPSLASALSHTHMHPHTHIHALTYTFPLSLSKDLQKQRREQSTWKCLCELIIEVHNVHLVYACETWQLPSNHSQTCQLLEGFMCSGSITLMVRGGRGPTEQCIQIMLCFLSLPPPPLSLYNQCCWWGLVLAETRGIRSCM